MYHNTGYNTVIQNITLSAFLVLFYKLQLFIYTTASALLQKHESCADPENFDIFLADVGMEDPNTASSPRQQNPILMAFPWRADDGPTLNADFVAL